MILLSWLLFILIAFQSYRDPAFARGALLNFAYPLTLLMVILCFSALAPWARRFLKGKRTSVILCLLLTLAVFVAVPPGYRVLSDETNLLSVSQSMHRDRSILNVTEAKSVHGSLQALNGGIPTRPLLFPFLTSLIHTATGYRYQNVFFLNFLILWGILILTWIPIEERRGRMVAFSSGLLLLSIPTLTLSGTSAGFDVCALLFVILGVVLLDRLHHKPSPETCRAFLPSLILLSQVRYESGTYALILLGLAWFLQRNRAIFEHSSRTLLASIPWFFLPMVLQRLLTPDGYENPVGVPPFSFDHLFRHTRMLLSGMIFPKPEYPYPSLLNLVSVVLGTVLVVLTRPFSKKSAVSLLPWALLLIPMLNLGVVLSHHFGRFTHPTQARLFLPFLVSLVLIPVWIHIKKPELLSRHALLGLAIGSWILYLPVASEARFTRSLTSIRETREGYRFLDTHADPRSMVITSHPGQYTVSGIGAFGFRTANQKKHSLIGELKRGFLSNIWVFQKHSYATGKPISGEELDPAFSLRAVEDFMITPEEFIRISKIDLFREVTP